MDIEIFKAEAIKTLEKSMELIQESIVHINDNKAGHSYTDLVIVRDKISDVITYLKMCGD